MHSSFLDASNGRIDSGPYCHSSGADSLEPGANYDLVEELGILGYGYPGIAWNCYADEENDDKPLDLMI